MSGVTQASGLTRTEIPVVAWPGRGPVRTSERPDHPGNPARSVLGWAVVRPGRHEAAQPGRSAYWPFAPRVERRASIQTPTEMEMTPSSPAT